MIRINLLPYRTARKKENVRRQLSLFVLMLIVLLAALFYGNIYLGGKIKKLHRQVDQTQAELERYNQINAEIAEIKKKLENLRQKMAVMEKLEAERHEPMRLMDTMTEVVIPKRMWFTRLESKDDRVNIKGIALDNKTVADFMVRLEKCGLFSSVNLGTLKKAQIQQSSFKSFEISCIKKPVENVNKTATDKEEA
jgi:type IV pilus assembly protein PilN